MYVSKIPLVDPSNVKFSITGDSCSDWEALMLLFLGPTWAETTSETPLEVKSCPVQGVTGRVEVLVNEVLMGRFLSRTKNTGRVSTLSEQALHYTPMSNVVHMASSYTMMVTATFM